MVSLYLDNDALLILQEQTDRHYSSGMKLVYSTQPDWRWLWAFADWGIFPGDATAAPAVGIFLGQNIYTPDHIRDPEKRGDNERKYAGWLYGGIFVQRRHQDFLDHLELNVGVIGPSAQAHRKQMDLHRLFNWRTPRGWEEQMSDEPTAEFTWVRKYRHTDTRLAPGGHLNYIIDVGLTVGSPHCHAEVGIEARGGLNLPEDFGPGRLATPASAAGTDHQVSKSVYLFTRLSGRAVAYNRFLSGLKHKPLTGRFEIGVGFRYKDFQISYSNILMTLDFENQGSIDGFGTLTMTLLF